MSTDPTTPTKMVNEGDGQDLSDHDFRPAPGQDVDTSTPDMATRDRDDITVPDPDPSTPDSSPVKPTSPARLARDQAAH